MTPADLAKAAAMSFECKKDVMRQNQSGDWKITFTVQAVDVPRRLTEAMPGTRYQAVIVQIGDDELPVHNPAEEVMPDTQRTIRRTDARPEPELNPPARAKRGWRDMLPSQQAGIRCEEPSFTKFIDESYTLADWNGFTSADAVRTICGVKSRSELDTNHAARVIWHQLNDHYEAWMKVGA